MKNCIHCGAELPDEANLCPACGQAQTEGETRKPYVFPWRKIGIALAAIVLLLAVSLAAGAIHIPKRYDDGGSEVMYADKTGTYRILASWAGGIDVQSSSIRDWTSKLEDEQQSTQPCKLFVYDPETDTNLQESFLEKVRSAEIRVTRRDGEATDIHYTEPAYNENYPQAMLESDLYYTPNSGVNDIVWTLQMRNGDTVVLHQSFTVVRLLHRVFTPEDTPLGSMADLQALLDRIWETDGADTIATIYLPPVTYEGNLMLDNRAYNLVGSSDSGQQTTFTGTVSVNSQDPHNCNFDSICFEGDGSGIGISATKFAILERCELRGWEIGAYARQGSWVGISECVLENNQVGLQFDSITSRGMMAAFESNVFTDNDTAVLLLNVPGSFPLSFANCQFTGNRVDIDNPAEHPLDLQDAAFD